MADVTTAEALRAALEGDGLAGVRVRGVVLEDVALEGVSLTAVAFLGCTFRRVSLTQATLTAVAFHDCVWEDCAWVGVVFQDMYVGADDEGGASYVLRTRFEAWSGQSLLFERCRFEAWGLGESHLTGLRIVGCGLYGALWAGVVLDGFLLEDSTIEESAWLDTLCEGVTMLRSALPGLRAPSLGFPRPASRWSSGQGPT